MLLEIGGIFLHGCELGHDVLVSPVFGVLVDQVDDELGDAGSNCIDLVVGESEQHLQHIFVEKGGMGDEVPQDLYDLALDAPVLPA